jgi:hypothetical protein
MRISHALLRLTILTHALSTTTTLANVPPVFNGYVDTKSIKNRESDFLQVNSTDLVLEERGVDSGDIEPRQLAGVIMLAIVAVAVVVALVVGLILDIEGDNAVSSNLMLLVCFTVDYDSA